MKWPHPHRLSIGVTIRKWPGIHQDRAGAHGRLSQSARIVWGKVTCRSAEARAESPQSQDSAQSCNPMRKFHLPIWQLRITSINARAPEMKCKKMHSHGVLFVKDRSGNDFPVFQALAISEERIVNLGCRCRNTICNTALL
jgi:hypothetical protein